MDGKVEISPVQSVTKRKINWNAKAFDSQNNNLNVGDIINVIDESLAVNYLYSFLFFFFKESLRTNKTSLSSFVSIFCSILVENGGLFVSKARNLFLAHETSKVSSIWVNALYISLRTMLTSSPHTSSTGSSSLIHSNSPASSGGGANTELNWRWWNKSSGLIIFN